MKIKLNLEFQYYKGLPLQLIHRGDYKNKAAKRFAINGTNQNVWIPNKHLTPEGTIKDGENMDYVFAVAKKQLELAGYMMGFVKISEPMYQRNKPAEQPVYPGPTHNRTHPSFQSKEPEPEHPEINSLEDYFDHGCSDMPY